VRWHSAIPSLQPPRLIYGQQSDLQPEKGIRRKLESRAGGVCRDILGRQSGHLGFLNYACNVAQVHVLALRTISQAGHESLSTAQNGSRRTHALHSNFGIPSRQSKSKEESTEIGDFAVLPGRTESPKEATWDVTETVSMWAHLVL
jgi:hypothetical protein